MVLLGGGNNQFCSGAGTPVHGTHQHKINACLSLWGWKTGRLRAAEMRHVEPYICISEIPTTFDMYRMPIQSQQSSAEIHINVTIFLFLLY